MMNDTGFGVHVLNDTLIVPVQPELDDDSVKQLQMEILNKAQAASITGVLIDMSAVRVLDSLVFFTLADTAKMVSLMGRRPVFAGFQAGVASALIDLNVDLEHITTALTMEDGLELLRSLTPSWKRDTQLETVELDEEAGNEEEEEDNEDEGQDQDIDADDRPF